MSSRPFFLAVVGVALEKKTPTMKTPTHHYNAPVTILLWSASLLLYPLAGIGQAGNQVLSLNGTNAYVSIPSAPELQNPTEITIDCWLFPTKTSGITYGSFINKGDGNAGDSQRTYELRWLPDGTLTFAVFFALPVSGDQPAYALISAPVAENTWTHVAATYNTNSSGLRLYTNGVLASAITSYASHSFIGLTLRQTTLPVVLGWTPSYPDAYASGGMDEVRLWNKARTQAEITDTMSCRLSGNELNLIGYWNFDSGTAADLTGNGHNGTLFGNASIVPLNGVDVIHAGCGRPVLDIRVSQVELCWDTVPTKWYQLQYESSLTTNQWVPFMTNWIAGNGSRFCTNDAVQADQAQRFYRIAITNSPPQ